jgi:hypothetical protein
MRRTFAVVAILVIALGQSFGNTARADSIVNELLEFADAKLEFSATGTGDQSYLIDLSRVSPTFFNKYAVLDARITYDLAAVTNPDCPPYLQISRSDEIGTEGDRVRRSASPRVGVQRVAIAQPRVRYYIVRVFRNAPGDVSSAGPCATIASVAYTLKVKLFASSPSGTSNFNFTQVRLPTGGDGEPSIAVDRAHGDAIYVSAPVGGPAVLGGTPGGVDFWRSFDGGATWSYSQPTFGGNSTTGGFDSHVLVADNGDVWLADLGVAAIYVGRSTDRGETFTGTTPAGIDSDREWLGLYTPPGAAAPTKTFISYHDINADNLPYECLIVNGQIGQPWCNPMATDPLAAANGFGNTVIGPQVFDRGGNVFSVFGTPGAPSAGAPAAIRNLYLARSADGVVFTNTLIYAAPSGFDVGGIFPVIAIDRADNLYVVWSERATPYGPSVAKISVSSNAGVTWSAPRTLSSPTGSAVLPWLVAGAAGQVDVVWVGATTGSSNDPTADWFVYMAQSQNALSASPKYTVSRVTAQPIRYGNICLSGLGCTTAGDDGRILLDFIAVDIDSHCDARLTFGNAGPEREDPASAPFTDVASQTSGTTICR